VSRISQTGQDAMLPIDVAAVCRRVIDEHLDSDPDRRIVLVAREAVHARANETSLEQVIDNLVANALKYAPIGAIEVRVSLDGEIAVVAVRDQGPGIPHREQQRIFERFERLDHATSRAGTGLGLYIARQLTRAMDGELVVDSEEGEGATFELRLAATAAPAEQGERRLSLVRDDLTA
jgi:signal transduction histidine kinase